MTRKLAETDFQSTTLAALSGGGVGTSVYDTLAELPLANNQAGARALVKENNRVYVWNNVGWYNIALINTNPSITVGPDAEYTLATDGTPTVITLAATDPEGVPITWSYAVTSGTLGNTTVTVANNTFTITPSINFLDNGSFSITFTASDGINIDTANANFTLQIPVGQAEYTTVGTYSWTAPAGVTSVCAVCVGAGGGPMANGGVATAAGGGGLGWKNNIPVTPGQSYTVTVGAGGTRSFTGTAPAGGNSWFVNASTVFGGGGGGGINGIDSPGGAGGTFIGDGGGDGGAGGTSRNSVIECGGGGGAGGYSGSGGKGGDGITQTATAGSGGGGGGGGGGGNGDTGGSGGGVGIYGQGASGNAGASTVSDGRGGFGGSSGSNATQASTDSTNATLYGVNNKSTPGNFGGGASGSDIPTIAEQGDGAGGAVRIIWGPGRSFPSTNTQDIP